jgi:hypothetical protein
MSAQPVEPIPLPRVSGPHRERALAPARKQRAIELRMQGLNYQQFADELSYANRAVARVLPWLRLQQRECEGQKRRSRRGCTGGQPNAGWGKAGQSGPRELARI